MENKQELMSHLSQLEVKIIEAKEKLHAEKGQLNEQTQGKIDNEIKNLIAKKQDNNTMNTTATGF